GLIGDVLSRVADLGFLHFQPQVGSLAGSLTDAGEDRVAAVLLRDAGDELLDDDGFAESRAAEESRFAAAQERREQIDHLDAGFEDLGFGSQVDEGRRLAVAGPASAARDDGAAVTDRLTPQGA